jgi:hypothetical protein
MDDPIKDSSSTTSSTESANSSGRTGHTTRVNTTAISDTARA